VVRVRTKSKRKTVIRKIFYY